MSVNQVHFTVKDVQDVLSRISDPEQEVPGRSLKLARVAREIKLTFTP
ncbi:hypothetical protein [Sinimarinibacterium sp. CAU 1509]|nr:hypothetical protein [Sinimarinibacterium sp. CAU 1509]